VLGFGGENDGSGASKGNIRFMGNREILTMFFIEQF
jgi:hypothetical protein